MNRMKTLVTVLMVVALSMMTGVVAAQDDNTTSPAAIVEIVGIIDSMDGETVIVGGATFNVGAAYIDDNVTLAPGVFIEIYAEFTTDGLVAFLVDDVNAIDDRSAPAEITGTVESMDDTSIVISGVRIDIAAASFDDTVNVGDTVEVYVTLADGAWTAAYIELDDDDVDDRDADYELTGILESIGDGFIVVGGVTIDAPSAAFDDDAVLGVVVEVEFNFVNGQRIVVYVDDLDDLDEDDVDYRIAYDVADDAQPTITARQAAIIALEVYPNATVIEIYLDWDDGKLVWEIELSNNYEFVIDSTSGLRLEIYTPSNESYYADRDNRSGWNSEANRSSWESDLNRGGWDSSDNDYDDDYDDDDDDDDD